MTTATLQSLTNLQPNSTWAGLPLFDRTGWKRVRFGNVVENCAETCDPEEQGLEQFVAMEHLEPGSLHVRAWGNVVDGTTFTRRCRPGQVLFGKRRAYQRKVAVAEFEAVVSGDIYVLAPKGDRLLLELLPFICLSERFFQHAVGTSAGSLSPRTNWSSLASFEFDLPPLAQQRRIAKILWAMDEVVCKWRDMQETISDYAQTVADEVFRKQQSENHELATAACETITVGIVVKPASYYTDADSGVPALRSLNVFPNRYDLSELVYLSQDGNDKHKKSQLRKGDVIVVRTGRPGDAAVVTNEIAGMNLIDLILVRPKPHLLPEYLVSFLNSAFGRRKIARGSAGTAQQHFNVGEFERLDLPVPKMKEQKKAIEKFEELESSSAACNTHTASVVALQKSLIEEILK